MAQSRQKFRATRGEHKFYKQYMNFISTAPQTSPNHLISCGPPTSTSSLQAKLNRLSELITKTREEMAILENITPSAGLLSRRAPMMIESRSRTHVRKTIPPRYQGAWPSSLVRYTTKHTSIPAYATRFAEQYPRNNAEELAKQHYS